MEFFKKYGSQIKRVFMNWLFKCVEVSKCCIIADSKEDTCCVGRECVLACDEGKSLSLELMW